MKIGNIKQIIAGMSGRYKSYKLKNRDYDDASLESEIKKLPLNILEETYQKRFNKNVDYDQWVGIRDELERMGRILYEKTLTIVGDSIFIIQKENEDKIEGLEQEIASQKEKIAELGKELKKYID